MIIGIDGSNLRSGGAITHLSEMLKAANPVTNGFSNVIVWGERALLNKLEDRVWLVKHHEPLLDRSLIYRLFWQRKYSSAKARNSRCNVLFIPSGIVLGDFSPVVTMSHNMLPFDWNEIKRYGPSWQLLRNLLLRFIMTASYRAADGMIFLTHFSQNKIMRVLKKTHNEIAIIHHGVNSEFSFEPKIQKDISFYSNENPYRVLYVSTVDMYKHQWNVVWAVAALRKKGIPIALDLVGTAFQPAMKILNNVINQVDQAQTFIRFHGPVPYGHLPQMHQNSDLCLFASSCENMPNILLEAMASGLPIACSDRGPMPEVLGEGGLYFNPEVPADIERALMELLTKSELRTQKARVSYERSKQFNWNRCSGETFKFLVKIANKNLRSL